MKKNIKIALVIIWMILIFLFSHQSGTGSDGLTEKVINAGISINEKITGKEKTGNEKEELIKDVFVMIRKTAHFFEYLILTVLIVSMLKEFDFSMKKRVLIAFFISFLFSCTDEFHQLFIDGRAARFFDILIDFCGSVTGMFGYLIVSKFRKDKEVNLFHQKFNLFVLSIFWIFILVSGFAVFKVKELNILEPEMVFGIAEMMILIVVSLFLIWRKWKKRIGSAFVSVTLVIFIVLFSVISLKMNEFINALSNITNKEITTDIYYVVGHRDIDQAYETLSFTIEELNHETVQTKIINKTLIVQENFSDLMKYYFENDNHNILISEAYHEMLIDENSEYESTYLIMETIKITTILDVETNDTTASEPFVLYISGIDTYGSITTKSRSDVNIVVVVNPKTHEMLLVHIPRDYYVSLYGKSGLKDKLTHAGIYGINTSMKTMEQLFDVNVDYYLRVNFNTVISLVDLIGGIEIKSDTSFTRGKNCRFVKGINYLDGECALVYSRERYVYASGDRHRGQNQQQVLTAIFNKIISPDLIMNSSKYLNILSDSFQTNMSYDLITNLVKKQIKSGGDWTINSISVDGTNASEYTYSYGSQKLYVMIPDMKTVDLATDEIKRVLGS